MTLTSVKVFPFDLDFWRVQNSYSVDCPSVWVCLVFSPFGENDTARGCALPGLSAEEPRPAAVSLLVMLTLITCWMVSARFLGCEFTCGKKLWDCVHTLFLVVLPPWILAYTVDFAAAIVVVFPKWWLSISILPAPFINWNCTLSKSFSSLIYLIIQLFN